MGEKHVGVTFGILTIGVVMMLAGAVVLIGAGQSPIFAVASSIATVLMAGFGVSTYINARRKRSDDHQHQQVPSGVAKRGSPGRGSDAGEMTAADYANWITSDPVWRKAGTKGYHNRLVKLTRRARGLLGRRRKWKRRGRW